MGENIEDWRKIQDENLAELLKESSREANLFVLTQKVHLREKMDENSIKVNVDLIPGTIVESLVKVSFIH